MFSIAFSFSASAQYVTRLPKDSANVETRYVTFSGTKTGVKGFQLTAVKVSGTVAGTVTLERRIDTLPTSATAPWVQVGSQSYTITNITAPQGDVFPITVHDGFAYRFKVVQSGGKVYLYASSLRW